MKNKKLISGDKPVKLSVKEKRKLKKQNNVSPGVCGVIDFIFDLLDIIFDIIT